MHALLVCSLACAFVVCQSVCQSACLPACLAVFRIRFDFCQGCSFDSEESVCSGWNGLLGALFGSVYLDKDHRISKCIQVCTIHTALRALRPPLHSFLMSVRLYICPWHVCLSVSACLHVCMHACMYACVHVNMYVCV